ncbi:restriction endonuclease subunit S [Stutzerimonas nitrititolerans]
MSFEWVTSSLLDHYEVRSGLSKPATDFGSGYPFLTFKDVFYNYFTPELLGDFVQATEKERESCSILRGDVFLTRTSETMHELGMSCVALRDYKDATFNGFCKRLRPKPDSDLLPEYVGYYLRSPRFRQAVSALSTMSTRASLNNEMIGRLEISFPSRTAQARISKILKSLDDRITLLRETNTTLEAIAQALFKSWFVDFDPVRAKAEGRQPEGVDATTAALFPDSFEESELGLVPKGWCVRGIGQVCELGRGSSPRPIQQFMGGDVPWIKIADATASDGMFVFETKEMIIKDGVKNSVKVQPGDLIMSNSASCGITVFVELDGCIHDGWLYFKNYQHISKNFLFFWLRKIADHLVHIADGSVQKNLNIALVSSQKIICPPLDVLQAFEIVAGSLLGRVRENCIQAQTLTQLRDTLLPRLISGQLRLPEAQALLNERDIAQ